MYDYLTSMVGQWIAVWCIRYCYRGQIKQVFDDGVLLSTPYAVETSGQGTADKTDTEDKIPSDIFISNGAIEMICQPSWVNWTKD